MSEEQAPEAAHNADLAPESEESDGVNGGKMVDTAGEHALREKHGTRVHVTEPVIPK